MLKWLHYFKSNKKPRGTLNFVLADIELFAKWLLHAFGWWQTLLYLYSDKKPMWPKKWRFYCYELHSHMALLWTPNMLIFWPRKKGRKWAAQNWGLVLPQWSQCPWNAYDLVIWQNLIPFNWFWGAKTILARVFRVGSKFAKMAAVHLIGWRFK